MTRSVEEYEQKKRALLEQFHQGAGATVSLEKKTSNLFRNRRQVPSKKLNVKQFNRVIAVDGVTAVVEGMATYEEIVAVTLKAGLLPAVVPQLKTITIGGAIVGLGIESSSYRYGLVHETVLEMEVLTGDGKTVIATPENEHRDLFYALPNSYGTLGYVLKATIRLIPAKPYVRLTHLRFNDPQTYFEEMESLCKDRKRAAYIDGVIFGPEECVITVGEFCDEAPYTSDYTYLNMYFRSLQEKRTDYLTAHDYIWRWDADWFWCSKHFGMQNRFSRLLFGKFALRSAFYWKIKHLVATHPLARKFLQLFNQPTESVIQDILIPVQNALPFYEFLKESIKIAPIWICPFQFHRKNERYTLCPQLDSNVLYLDFGFWDMVPSALPKGHFNRLIEQNTQKFEGFKSLYSDSYYSEEEFWSLYSKNTYQALKKKYDPHGSFKGLYEKCVLSL